jgi:hypothetical protein
MVAGSTGPPQASDAATAHNAASSGRTREIAPNIAVSAAPVVVLWRLMTVRMTHPACVSVDEQACEDIDKQRCEAVNGRNRTGLTGFFDDVL